MSSCSAAIAESIKELKLRRICVLAYLLSLLLGTILVFDRLFHFLFSDFLYVYFMFTVCYRQTGDCIHSVGADFRIYLLPVSSFRYFPHLFYVNFTVCLYHDILSLEKACSSARSA
jgi:hypothetical protein